VVLSENNVPLGKWTLDDEDFVWIFDDEVPLGDLPHTADDIQINVLILLSLISFAGLVILLAIPVEKKKCT
jgi:hypothetical protein